uniref:sphingomyelin phosphodiesterase n=1 Tax=Catharus ustulatus TaxID=91951 RepID=A0A8C3UIC9_CATUS
QDTPRLCPPSMPWPPPSTLPDSPFPSRTVAAVAAVAEALLTPCYWSAELLLGLQPTTAERARWRRHRAGPYLAVALRVLAAPVLALARRRPFVLQHTATAAVAEPWEPRSHGGFTFVSANVCLLPSGLARFSNLAGTRQRAAAIGRLLAAGQRSCQWPEWQITMPDPMPPVLSTHIPPDTDFLCLQEVFDAAAANELCRRLGRRFPYLLWGVGPGGLRCGRLRVLGSGLLMASRYPLLAARFHPFPNGAREDALANKGLLVAQVLLGTGRGRRVLGYLSCTHLQAPAPDAAIRGDQLTNILDWLRKFRQDVEKNGDLVAFNVLCGDLNFDNCSRGDAPNQRHPLFEEFFDPARLRCGQDQPWAIGGDSAVTSVTSVSPLSPVSPVSPPVTCVTSVSPVSPVSPPVTSCHLCYLCHLSVTCVSSVTCVTCVTSVTSVSPVSAL